MILNKLVHTTFDNFQELKGANAVIDPAFIDMIADLVKDLLYTFSELCQKSPGDVASIANSPTRLQILRLEKRTRDLLGFVEYRQHGRDVVTALLATGKTVTPEDIEEAYVELW